MIQKHVRDKEWKNGHWPGLLRAEKSPILWYFLLLGTLLTPTFSCGIISAHRCCLNRLAYKKLSESNSPINGNIYKLCQTVSTSSEKQFQNSFPQHGYDLTHVLRPEEAELQLAKHRTAIPLHRSKGTYQQPSFGSLPLGLFWFCLSAAVLQASPEDAVCDYLPLALRLYATFPSSPLLMPSSWFHLKLLSGCVRFPTTSF